MWVKREMDERYVHELIWDAWWSLLQDPRGTDEEAALLPLDQLEVGLALTAQAPSVLLLSC